MAETTTITKPAPVIEGSLTAFLNEVDKLGKGAVPTGFSGIDTSVYDPKVAQQTKLQLDAAKAAGFESIEHILQYPHPDFEKNPMIRKFIDTPSHECNDYLFKLRVNKA